MPKGRHRSPADAAPPDRRLPPRRRGARQEPRAAPPHPRRSARRHAREPRRRRQGSQADPWAKRQVPDLVTPLVAYVGEVLRRASGGRWVKPPATYKQREMVYGWTVTGAEHASAGEVASGHRPGACCGGALDASQPEGEAQGLRERARDPGGQRAVVSALRHRVRPDGRAQQAPSPAQRRRDAPACRWVPHQRPSPTRARRPAPTRNRSQKIARTCGDQGAASEPEPVNLVLGVEDDLARTVARIEDEREAHEAEAVLLLDLAVRATREGAVLLKDPVPRRGELGGADLRAHALVEPCHRFLEPASGEDLDERLPALHGRGWFGSVAGSGRGRDEAPCAGAAVSVRLERAAIAIGIIGAPSAQRLSTVSRTHYPARRYRLEAEPNVWPAPGARCVRWRRRAGAPTSPWADLGARSAAPCPMEEARGTFTGSAIRWLR